jgi:hypothetical protein
LMSSSKSTILPRYQDDVLTRLEAIRKLDVLSAEELRWLKVGV